jgi:hypothetical protein
MKKTFAMGVACAVIAAASVSAQSADATGTPDPIKERQKISMMEGVLERAVQNGADNLFRQLRASMPSGDSPRLIGAPEVRGFRLDGYGVFFDVEVPDLMLPTSWSLRYMMDQNGLTAANAVADIRAMLPQVRDPQQRQTIEQAIMRLEAQVGPGPARPRLAGNNVAAAEPQNAPPVAPVDPGIVQDPNEGYTREVKSTLIEAMLENSGPIVIGADEWLTVAARGNQRIDRIGLATDSGDTHTILFRVKGADLAAFHERRISPEEAKARVLIREY